MTLTSKRVNTGIYDVETHHGTYRVWYDGVRYCWHVVMKGSPNGFGDFNAFSTKREALESLTEFVEKAYYHDKWGWIID